MTYSKYLNAGSSLHNLNTIKMKEDSASCKLSIGIDIHKNSLKIKTSTDLLDGKSFTCPYACAIK